MIARPSSVQKVLGKDEIISSVSPRSKARLIRFKPEFNNFVGQAKIVQALSELDKFLFLAPLQVFGSFAVATPLRIALCEERVHREGLA